MKNKTLGFTLAEILVAIVIGMISIAAAFSAYNYFSKSYASVSQKAAISKSAREALSLIASDLRNTGYYHVDFESKNCMKFNANNINQFLIDNDAEIKDNIVIGTGTILDSDSCILGPVIIGKNCTIGPNVKLGPYVSVGDNCNLNHCTIQNSIIMTDCIIDVKVDFESSIISHGSEIMASDIPKKCQLLLGERSQINL